MNRKRRSDLQQVRESEIRQIARALDLPHVDTMSLCHVPFARVATEIRQASLLNAHSSPASLSTAVRRMSAAQYMAMAGELWGLSERDQPLLVVEAVVARIIETDRLMVVSMEGDFGYQVGAEVLCIAAVDEHWKYGVCLWARGAAAVAAAAAAAAEPTFRPLEAGEDLWLESAAAGPSRRLSQGFEVDEGEEAALERAFRGLPRGRGAAPVAAARDLTFRSRGSQGALGATARGRMLARDAVGGIENREPAKRLQTRKLEPSAGPGGGRG